MELPMAGPPLAKLPLEYRDIDPTGTRLRAALSPFDTLPKLFCENCEIGQFWL
ncbi:hypothetical protein [Sphingomonas sp. ACRSK]|uniref:hypothetical protein n=1 Tax=Sphingomonas sp. ACRSK TaxID=2918213 RepID=UPI001EF6C740|nr:hypothetical protein [Sphingomonas sp. ACRSK]